MKKGDVLSCFLVQCCPMHDSCITLQGKLCQENLGKIQYLKKLDAIALLVAHPQI